MLKIDLPQKLQQEFERAAQASIPKIVFVTHSSKQLVYGSLATCRGQGASDG